MWKGGLLSKYRGSRPNWALKFGNVGVQNGFLGRNRGPELKWGFLGKSVWERNIWLEIGDLGQIKMVLFRKVGALPEKDILGYLYFYASTDFSSSDSQNFIKYSSMKIRSSPIRYTTKR